MTPNGKNDPRPNVAYARCEICEADLATPDQAQEHMRSTMEPVDDGGPTVARGHRVRIVNRTRPERVQTQVDEILERVVQEVGYDLDMYTREFTFGSSALDFAASDLDEAVSAGDMTPAEVTRALAPHQDFLGAWLLEHPDEAPIPASQGALFETASAAR